MPVLSWSLGCQPEYGKPAQPGQHTSSSAQGPAIPAPTDPPPTTAEPQQEAKPAKDQAPNPGTTTKHHPNHHRHTWATLPVPRKGHQAGEVRARSANPLRSQHTSPSPACPATQDPLPGKARLARPSEPILVPKLRIKIADFPYLH